MWQWVSYLAEKYTWIQLFTRLLMTFRIWGDRKEVSQLKFVNVVKNKLIEPCYIFNINYFLTYASQLHIQRLNRSQQKGKIIIINWCLVMSLRGWSSPYIFWNTRCVSLHSVYSLESSKIGIQYYWSSSVGRSN